MSSLEAQNIKVVCRIRPIDDDKREDAKEAVSASGNQLRVTTATGAVEGPFELHKVYDKTATNDLIFREQILPLVDRVLAGFNCFVMAYGASRTGKSHTLSGAAGSTDNEGIIAKTADTLFERIEAAQASTPQRFFVTVSMFQIRRGALLDLLNPKPRETLKLLSHRAFGVCVDPLAELEVSNAKELRRLIEQGQRTRDALLLRSATLGSPHTVIDVRVDSREADKGPVRQSLLRFVQAAGSGGQATLLDPSLKVLQQVVQELTSERNALVSFGQSPLTRLLELGMGGNALATWLVFVDPTEENAADSIHALQLGDRVGKIKNVPRVNLNTIATTIKQLREEIKSATKRLELANPRQYFHDLNPQQLDGLKLLIAELERVKKQTWEQRRAASQEAAAERKESLKAEGLSGVLAEVVEVPAEKLAQADARLADLMKQVELLGKIDHGIQQKTRLYNDLYAAQRRRLADAGPDAEVKDERLSKLQTQVAEYTEALRKQRAALSEKEKGYRQLWQEIIALENEKKTSLLATDAAQIHKETELWRFHEVMRDKVSKDAALAAELEELSSMWLATEKQVNDAFQALEAPGKEPLWRTCMDNFKRLRDFSQDLKRKDWETRYLYSKLLEQQYRHEAALQRYQDHTFFIFRNYRSHFEAQKTKIEARYRELVESSVKDALRLAEENARLKAQLEAKARLGIS